MGWTIGKKVWQFLIKLKIQMSHCSALSLCNIYSRERKAYIHKKDLYTGVHRSIINDSQKKETNQISFKGWRVRGLNQTTEFNFKNSEAF